MLIKKIRKFRLKIAPHGSFRANVLTLMTGTAVAQLIAIFVSPFLTRFYLPEDFGLFVLYTSMSTTLSVLVTGRYDQAIMLPKEDSDAINLVKLSFFIITIFTLCVSFILCCFSSFVTSFFGNKNIEFWLYLMPVSICCTGISSTISYWFNRKKQFSVSAKRRVIQAIIMISVQIMLGMLHVSTGLIIGWICGEIIVSLYFVVSMSFQEKLLMNTNFNFRVLRKLAVEYKRFPIYDIPTTFIHTLTNQVPVMLFSSYFGPAVAGFYGLTQRTLNVPITFVAQSVADVFKQKVSEEYLQRGSCQNIYIKIVKGLLLIVLPFCLVLLLGGPSIFVLIFGDEWWIAGQFARFLSIYYGLRFFANATSYIFFVVQKQQYNLWIQGAMLFAVFGAMSVGVYLKNYYFAVLSLGILGALVYAFCLVWTYKLACVPCAQKQVF